MIINIRGTNGSGKSTVVRDIMEKATKSRPIFGALGPSKPEAYEVTFDYLSQSVYVLGPYVTPAGGCDAVQPFKLILELVEKYAVRGHVIFEGSLVSDHYGKMGALLETYKDVLVFFLDTPLEECISRIEARRAEAGNSKPFNRSNTEARYVGIQRVRDRIETDGLLRFMSGNSDEAIDTVMRSLPVT